MQSQTQEISQPLTASKGTHLKQLNENGDIGHSTAYGEVSLCKNAIRHDSQFVAEE